MKKAMEAMKEEEERCWEKEGEGGRGQKSKLELEKHKLVINVIFPAMLALETLNIAQN